MFEGVKVTIGDRDFVIPALTMKQLRTGALELIRQNDQLISESKALESFIPRVKVITMAIRRNYPEVTEEMMEDLLDMRNINPIWLAALGASDLLGPGGEAPQGDPTTSGPRSDG